MITVFFFSQLTQKIQELSAKKESVTTEFQSILKDLREQNNKKTELEQKIEKIRLAKIQIRKQLDQLQATAEPEVASVDILVPKKKHKFFFLIIFFRKMNYQIFGIQFRKKVYS